MNKGIVLSWSYVCAIKLFPVGYLGKNEEIVKAFPSLESRRVEVLTPPNAFGHGIMRNPLIDGRKPFIGTRFAAGHGLIREEISKLIAGR